MPEFTDKNRLLLFKADGKTDFLLPTSFFAVERMSGLFNVHVQLLAAPDKVGQVKGDQLLGKAMSLRISLSEDYAKGPFRYFHGVCSRFASTGKDHRFSYFEAELVPWMWMLTRKSDFRVYQDKNVPDIVETVLKELQGDFGEFQFEIRAQRGNYKKIDYCAQFKETHFDFISRLMEQDGLYYYFEHAESGHKLIIDDSLTAGNDVPNQAEVRYQIESGPDEIHEDTIFRWRDERIIHSGKFAARDYHSQLAQNKIEFSGIAPKTIVGKNDKLEVFEWPSHSGLRYNQTDQRLDEVNTVGDKLTNVRAQESEATHHTYSGESHCRGFLPGYRFSLKHEPGKKYLLTQVQHSAAQNASYTSDETVAGPYTNGFTCIPADVQFRPRRTTPKPVVDGLQSAKVVGKSGEEIYIDKYGRVRVQFFWDRKGENNEKSTCWVRVAQLAAGKRWGASFWPRIGQEVMVAFVEGDPDQPIIVGTVYNNQQMPPYLGEGPDDKHKHDPNVSGIKTNSTKGGDGFNELRFDDTKDKEQVFIHAEKDMDVRVKNETREQTVGDRYMIVGDENNSEDSGNLYQLVHKNWMTDIKKDLVEKVEGDSFLTVGMGENSNGGSYFVDVEKNCQECIGGNRHLKVKGDRMEEVTGQHSMTLGQLDIAVSKVAALDVASSLHIKAMNIVIEADMQLSLKVGGNFVDISVAGVAINGMPMTLINSGGAAGVGLGAHPASPGEPDHLDASRPPLKLFKKADDSKTGSKSCD